MNIYQFIIIIIYFHTRKHARTETIRYTWHLL